MYDFNLVIDRHNTNCIKYDRLRPTYGRDDLIPLWIADMDFRTPEFITDAIAERLKHPVFGYGCIPSEYFKVISAWVKKLHGWDVSPDHIRYIPGIIKGIAAALDCFVPKNSKIVIMPPVYHPFRNVPEKMGYEIVSNPLIPIYDEEGFLTTYRMDFEDLESKLSADSDIKAIIISNPHNPCGIVWDAVTLRRLAEIAHKHGTLVISDEIHCEMVLGSGTHTPYASVSAEAGRSITFMAPSKTFNIAGIVSSYTIVQDETLREKFFNYLDARELDSPAIFPVTATMAAYEKGWEWRNEMLEYVEGNIGFIDSWLRNNLPQIRVVHPDASFLVWLDCRKTGLSHESLIDMFVNKAGLALNDGAMFGEEGSGFMRLNVGCPRKILEEALLKLKAVL